MTTTFIGNIYVSGSGYDTIGDTETLSGSLGITISANLDSQGNGTATETINSDVTYEYTSYNGYTGSGTLPLNFTSPNFSMQAGNFQLNEPLQESVLGIDLTIDLSGSVNVARTAIVENVSVTGTGSYQGITGFVTLFASGTLVAPLIISGTQADLPTSDTTSISPFLNVVVSDTNPAESVTLTVTLSQAANGTLANLSGGTYNVATGVYTISGTTAVVTAALNGLVFDPTPHQAQPGQTVTTAFTINVANSAGAGASDDTTTVLAQETFGPTISTVASFNGGNGEAPGTLIADAAGNLYGTAFVGGASQQFGFIGYGTVFEDPIGNTSTGYAFAPITIANFNQGNGQNPVALAFDGAGNLLGVTKNGGPFNGGALFEVAKTSSGYANAPIVLVGFNGFNGLSPDGGIAFDAAGDIFGTTYVGGGSGEGEVFEVAKSAGAYATAPIILASFDGGDGANPVGNLLVDGAGNVFGVTANGGAYGFGTVFEVVKSGGTYATTPTVLFSFNNADGADPHSLVFDAAGDLFGATIGGGPDGDGTVFEIAATPSGYAPATTLVTFDGADGTEPQNLVFDAAGHLFGATASGGPHNAGTIFELATTPNGYASVPTTLVSFDGSNGSAPNSLIFDSAGDLLGTTGGGGPNFDGTVFEVTNIGITVTGHNATVGIGGTVPGSAMVTASDADGDPITEYGFYDAGGDGGHFEVNGVAQPDGQWIAVAADSLSSIDYVGAPMVGGEPVYVSAFDGTQWAGRYASLTATTAVLFAGESLGNIPPNWSIASTGDFSGDGNADLLWRDTGGDLDLWLSAAGSATFPGSEMLSSVPPNWSIAATGDFSGDGNDDLLWRDTGGNLDLWLTAAGAAAFTSSESLTNVPSNWSIAGTGDFRGDGNDDLLWRDTSGNTELWLSAAGTATFAGLSLSVVSPDWSVAGVGDFNGDGKADILWRDSGGDLELWSSAPGGGISFTGASLGNVPANWRVAGIGDFNGDGKADIVWRDTAGDAQLWVSGPGAGISFGGQSLGNVGTAWNVQAVADFQGNHTAGILWRDTAGDTVLWNTAAL